MDYAHKYVENEVLTSRGVNVTMIVFKDLIEKMEYIIRFLNPTDIDSFESEEALDKLDRMERMLEDQYMEFSKFSESFFVKMADCYQEIIEGLQTFKQTYNKVIIQNALRMIKDLQEGYEEVIKRDENQY